MQYRADDMSRCRPVKREGPPVATPAEASASSSGASAHPSSAKRQKIMLEMVEATDDDLLSTLNHEELKKVLSECFWDYFLRVISWFVGGREKSL